MKTVFKQISIVITLLIIILALTLPANSEINLNFSQGSVTILDQKTLRIHNVTADIDGTPVQGKYWIDFKWDAHNLVSVPVNLGVEQTAQALRIFLSSGNHVGDFKNDPLLPGSTAIQKADAFCNVDAGKPNGSIYKALLVDGLTRDAVKSIDWVLQPNTTYYRSDGTTIIGTTTDKAIFPSLYKDLDNSIIDLPSGSDPFAYMNYTVWTGIVSASDFSTSPTSSQYNCGGWSLFAGGTYGKLGYASSKDRSAFSADPITDCNNKVFLYCVEQP